MTFKEWFDVNEQFMIGINDSRLHIRLVSEEEDHTVASCLCNLYVARALFGELLLFEIGSYSNPRGSYVSLSLEYPVKGLVGDPGDG